MGAAKSFDWLAGRWARIRNSETPARFRPTGLPLGRPSRCRLAPSNRRKAKVDGWGRKPSQTAGTGWADGTALGSTARKQPFQRHVNLPSETGKPQQDSNPTDCSRLAEPLLFSTFKAEVDGWSTKLWQAAGIGWAGVTALSKTVRHQPFQRHVTAPSVTGEHPKQGNPSKIRAQRVATWLAEPLPFGTFEPPKSKGGRVKQEALASSRHWLGERNGAEQHRAASAIPKARHSPQRHPWARIRNRESTFEPPKTKGGWVRQKALIDWQAGEHASETAKRQQDSGPPGCHLVGRAAAVWHLRTR